MARPKKTFSPDYGNPFANLHIALFGEIAKTPHFTSILHVNERMEPPPKGTNLHKAYELFQDSINKTEAEVAEYMLELIRSGNYEGIQTVAEIVRRKQNNNWKEDYFRKTILLIFDDLAPERPTKGELHARIQRELGKKVSLESLDQAVKEMGLRYENSPGG